MKKIAIIGGSGFSKDIKELIEAINEAKEQWELIGFFDDNIDKGVEVLPGFKSLGKINKLENFVEELCLVFSIENRNVVKNIYEKLKENKKLTFPTIIHPKAFISPTLNIGKGNVILANAYLSCDINLGNFNLINVFVILGHDVSLGNFNSLMPRVQVAGNVEIGNCNFFGMNSGIYQGVKIGNDNQLLGFSFLTKSIKSKRKYFGIPARKIEV